MLGGKEVRKLIAMSEQKSLAVEGDAASQRPEGYPPPGYPTQAPQTQYVEVPAKTQQRGEKGFIEGCLAGLCCCWLCEECC